MSIKKWFKTLLLSDKKALMYVCDKQNIVFVSMEWDYNHSMYLVRFIDGKLRTGSVWYDRKTIKGIKLEILSCSE